MIVAAVAVLPVVGTLLVAKLLGGVGLNAVNPALRTSAVADGD